jgi:hypothetical protein
MFEGRKPLQKPINHVVQHRIIRKLRQKIKEDTDGTRKCDNAKAGLDILDPRIQVTILSVTKRHKEAGHREIVKGEGEEETKDLIFNLGVYDKWPQRLSEGLVADVGLKERKNSRDRLTDNMAHLEILRIHLVIDHSLGPDDKYETCNLDSIAMSLFFTFSSGAFLAAHRES